MFFFFLNSILINFYTGKTDFSYYLSFIILPILVIFLIFNKPKAKIFMGDAGSIFLGFIIGYVVLDLFVKGYWYYSISLIIYPLVDCTITLIKKVRKGYMPWKGLYDYYFLIPVIRNKCNHLNVLIIMLIFNIINSTTIFLSLKYSNHFFLIISFIISIVVIKIFKSVKIENYF